MKSIIIEIDAYKEKLPGYNPEKAWDHHRESVRLADQDFKRALKNPKFKKVILMCGGSASGKTEFSSSHLVDKDVIVYDGTLYNVEGAKVKIRNIKRNKKTVEIFAIIPDNISKSFGAFLVRNRKVPISVFFKTHSGCRETLLWILQNHPEIPIRIFESSVSEENKLQINERTFGSKRECEEFIKNIQLRESQIEQLILP